MATRMLRVGPSAGSGSVATVYTAPSGTTAGSARGGWLLEATFSNSAGTPTSYSMSIGAFAAGTTVVPTSYQLPAVSVRQHRWNSVPLTPGDIIQVTRDANTAMTLVIKESILDV